MPQLLITLPNGSTFQHALGTVPQLAGRDAACDIVLDDPGTSRRHARFAPTPEGYAVEDLGSKNGTLVNDEPCTRRLLRDGDEVLLGSVAAVFIEGDTQASSRVVIADDATTTHATKYVSKDKELALPQRRLRVIYELSGRLTTLQHRDDLLEDAMTVCLEMLQFERGAIGIKPHGQRGLDWPVVRNIRGPAGELTISRTLLRRALEHGERAIFTGGESAPADPTISIVQHGIRSAMCVPLLHRDEILGVIYGDRLSTSTPYTNEDVDFLAGIAQQVSIGLINARLLEEQRRLARLNHDIEVARRIQTGLLPSALPNQPGLRMAAINEPGQRVSGDYYDVIDAGGGRVWCLIADVTGEGVSAALLMANLQAAVRATIHQSSDPATMMTQWNRLICRNTDSSKFITCFCALIDTRERVVHYANAGHLSPFVVQAAGDRPMLLPADAAAYPLGVAENTVYASQAAHMGDDPYLMFAYTDGVIEAINAEGRMFGAERLVEVLAAQRELNPSAMVKQVRKAVTHFVGNHPQSDDITMLAARVG